MFFLFYQQRPNWISLGITEALQPWMGSESPPSLLPASTPAHRGTQGGQTPASSQLPPLPDTSRPSLKIESIFIPEVSLAPTYCPVSVCRLLGRITSVPTISKTLFKNKKQKNRILWLPLSGRYSISCVDTRVVAARGLLSHANFVQFH